MTEIPIHSRVALKDGVDQVYLFALTGTEGWVRESKIDDDGYNLVRIEWDKEHWRYNGQSDGWTFANHFKVVGPPEYPKEQTEPVEVEGTDLDGQTLQAFGSIELEGPPTDEQLTTYIDTLAEATDAASEGEAFLMIAVRRVPNPENPSESMYVPQIFTTSTTRESALLLDIQLAECASSSYEEMVFHLIEQLKRRKHDDS